MKNHLVNNKLILKIVKFMNEAVISAKPATPVYKTFEITFVNEPTPDQMHLIYQNGCSWQNVRAIKQYPHKITKEKTDYGYWLVKFEVPESDWLFWCGYVAGRSLGISVGKEGDPLTWYNKKMGYNNPDNGYY